jgi:hypothetical protein
LVLRHYNQGVFLALIETRASQASIEEIEKKFHIESNGPRALDAGDQGADLPIAHCE